MDIQSQIRDVLHESIRGDEAVQEGHIRGDDLLEALRQKGVVDDILRQLQFDSGGVHPGMQNGALTGAPKPATHFIDKDDKLTTAVNARRGEIYSSDVHSI